MRKIIAAFASIVAVVACHDSDAARESLGPSFKTSFELQYTGVNLRTGREDL